ncbi:MAG: hypothetical protein IID34_09950 [Planctomycetes bacterium]|nr:hypothetical protein [Planctomycetota bacterium]MCH8969870.1 hypothetical protein [Planctomycetota bacterium]
METMVRKPIPPGTLVRVEQVIQRRAGAYSTVVEGEVVSHEMEPTGAWFAHGKKGRLWLTRLRIKKPDGEISALNLDSNSIITILKPGP